MKIEVSDQIEKLPPAARQASGEQATVGKAAAATAAREVPHTSAPHPEAAQARHAADEAAAKAAPARPPADAVTKPAPAVIRPGTLTRSASDPAAKAVEFRITLPSAAELSAYFSRLKRFVGRLRLPALAGQSLGRLPWQRLPKLSDDQHRRIGRLAARLPRSRRGRLIAAGASLAVLSVIALTGFVLAAHHRHQPASAASGTAASTGGQPPRLQRGTPGYATLLPAGKTIQSLGGWTRISPPGRNPVYAYTDKVAGVPVSVSQQPLPPAFRTDTEHQVDELARNFGATEKIAASGTTVHIGNSVKGPQSVILAKAGTLILIKSDAPVSNDQWTAYVSSLH